MASSTGQTGTARYTAQTVLLLSSEARAVIDIAARENDLTQAAVTRAFLYAGMRAAGYDFAPTDEAQTLDLLVAGASAANDEIREGRS